MDIRLKNLFARPRHRKIHLKIFHYNNTFPMLPFYFLIALSNCSILFYWQVSLAKMITCTE